MRRFGRLSALPVLLLAAAAGGCARPPPSALLRPLPTLGEQSQPAQVLRVEQAPQLRPRGPFAAASPGDFLLRNDRVAVVVAGLAAPIPGAVLDAGRPGGDDALRELVPLVGVDPAPPRFERAEIEDLGGVATLRLRGVDPAAPSVEVVAEYSLHPGASGLSLITTVRQRGRSALQQYKLGDRVDWGAAEPFAPGLGRSPSGRPLLDWVGAFSAEASYLYFRASPVAADFSGETTQLLLDTLELTRGAEASVSRQLAVGGGGQLASLLAPLLAARGIPAGALEIAVTTDDGEPLPAATVEVQQGAGLLTLGQADSSGALRLELAPGRYALRASSPDRLGPPVAVSVAAGGALPVRLQTGPPSRLLFEVHEGDGPATVPARLVVLGIGPTRTPWLGPPHQAAAHHHLLSPSGRGSLPLPPGRYRVIVTRGPEHSLVQEDLELRPNSGASLVARPRRVVDSSGFVALDLDERTRASEGSAVAPGVRLLAASLEGLGALGLAGERSPRAHAALLVLPGRRGVDPGLGPFSVLAAGPLSPLVDPELLADAVVELDDARRPGGLLEAHGFDPQSPLPELVPPTVSALRVLDGQHPEDFDRLFADWLALLRCGRRLTATAASGSRSIAASTAGYPRTYVEIPPGAAATAGALVQALREGRAVVSSGPLLRISANGVGPGGTVTLAASRGRTRAKREVAVRIQVSAPAWIGLDEVRLSWNGEPGRALPIPGRADGVRLDQTVTVPVTGDGFLVALVRGSTALTPAVETPGPLRPLALSNPIWVDADGDGKVTLSCKERGATPGQAESWPAAAY